jgi:hypothetical protein
MRFLVHLVEFQAQLLEMQGFPYKLHEVSPTLEIWTSKEEIKEEKNII